LLMFYSFDVPLTQTACNGKELLDDWISFSFSFLWEAG